MIVGHAPSGYILARLFFERMARRGVGAQALVLAGLSGALAPDLDMFYFYWVDGGQRHHHTYFTHFPVFWLGLCGLAGFWLRVSPASRLAPLALLFSLGGLVHMVLDSIVGDIWWLAPWLDKPFALFEVPARFQPWWLNFILHGSFLLELALWAWGWWLWRRWRSG